MHMEEYRINKYLAMAGICSRREADRLIEKGEVLIDGRRALPGTRVSGDEDITVSGKKVKGTEERCIIAFYKPVGVLCTHSDPHAEKTVFDIVDVSKRVTYAGRLDKDSEGLLLLTNDGDLI
ncbi:MAG: rRNA pseudouridine synthase, partial [Lachnospiraceae bacterium]|nr:rRNA pseudouridine synthase [Lachnospiraceae bacterium]